MVIRELLSEDTVVELLRKGAADVNACGGEGGCTALQLASKNGPKNVVSLLLSKLKSD